MSDEDQRQLQYLRDRARYERHDPFSDSVIEFKLIVEGAGDPFDLLRDIEESLKGNRLPPYEFDSFWTTEREFLGTERFTLQTFVFGFQDGLGVMREAFKVVQGFGRYRIREKSTAAVHGEVDDLASWVLDRKERDEIIEGAALDRLLTFVDEQWWRDGRSLQYLGSYTREVMGTACRNRELMHRYALMADRCTSPVHERALRQLKLEYIWRREPIGRPITKDEIHADVANLARTLLAHFNRNGALVLSPSSLTKLAWLSSVLR